MYTFARSALLLAFPLSLALAACEGGGGTSPGNVCVHRCTSDADCAVDGRDIGLTCQSNACVRPQCTSDEACLPDFSLWLTPCTAGGTECDADLGEVCIETALGPRCAYRPTESFPCSTLGFVELARMDLDGNAVTVCGDERAQCGSDGVCRSPCRSDADCVAALPICDTSTGQCTCNTDATCALAGLPSLSVCVDGRCGCSRDQDCIDDNLGDVCLSNGECGCSGDSACGGQRNFFSGGSIVCGQ